MLKRKTVHIAEVKDFSTEVLARLSKDFYVRTDAIQKNELRRALNECDIFWFRLGFQITEDVLGDGVRCRFILAAVTGLDHIDLAACERVGITVLSLRGERQFLQSVRATAEHTLGLTLSLIRHTCQAVEHVKQGDWDRDKFKGHEVYGKRVGVLGVGRLGSIIATYFNALGAVVYGYDINPIESSVCQFLPLKELFADVDILTVHLAYNEGTHHIVDKDLLKLMPGHAILINTARGGVVKSEDLLWALKNKIIAGAAVDVIEDEHQHNKSELVAYAKSHNNLLITPHIAGNTYESFLKTEMFLCDKLMQVLSDERG